MNARETQYMESALASSAMEGFHPTDETRETIRRLVDGELTIQEYIAAAKQQEK